MKMMRVMKLLQKAQADRAYSRKINRQCLFYNKKGICPDESFKLYNKVQHLQTKRQFLNLKQEQHPIA